MNEREAKKITEKVDQALRILSKLWDRRIKILIHYFKEKSGLKTFIFAKRGVTQDHLSGIFLELRGINHREARVIEILDRGTIEAIRILSSALQLPNAEREMLTPYAWRSFNENINNLINLIQKYRQLTSVQKSILELERELFKSQEEEKLKLYLKRIDYFSAEVRDIFREHRKIQHAEEFFKEMEKAITIIRQYSEKKGPRTYIAPSVVSAVGRVLVSNVIAGVTMKYRVPYLNYFWDLTWRTMISVTMVNFTDYYYNIFSDITNKISRLLRIAPN